MNSTAEKELCNLLEKFILTLETNKKIYLCGEYEYLFRNVKLNKENKSYDLFHSILDKRKDYLDISELKVIIMNKELYIDGKIKFNI